MTAHLREVEAERRAACAIDEITVARRDWARKNRKPSTFTAREALMVLEFEAMFVSVAAGNLASGVALSEADHDRLRLAYQRIATILAEVTG